MEGGGTKEPQRRPQAVRVEKTTRRRAIGRILGALGVLSVAAGASINEWGKANNKPPEPSATGPVEVKPPAPENREADKKNKLNLILSLRLNDPARQAKEKDYVSWATNLEEVDLGLLSIVNQESRIALLEKRYHLRNSETPNHKPLTKDQLDWAQSEGIYAETLGISLEAREIAIRILPEILKKKGIDAQRKELEGRVSRGELPRSILDTFESDPQFAEGIKRKGIEDFRSDVAEKVKKGELSSEVLNSLADNPELMLLSAGGMSRLIVTESGIGIARTQNVLGRVIDKIAGRDWIMYGFANIGKKPAVEMTVDSRAFPKKPSDEAISFLTEVLSQKTGLQFQAENIPGSERDANSVSGGALGIQIMPSRAKEMYENLKQYFKPGDPIPHPLDPKGSAVLAYLFLAQGAVNKDGYQPGYVKGPLMEKGRDISQGFNTEAIKTWNPHPKQAFEIITSDQTFLKKVTSQRVPLPAAA